MKLNKCPSNLGEISCHFSKIKPDICKCLPRQKLSFNVGYDKWSPQKRICARGKSGPATNHIPLSVASHASRSFHSQWIFLSGPGTVLTKQVLVQIFGIENKYRVIVFTKKNPIDSQSLHLSLSIAILELRIYFVANFLRISIIPLFSTF